MLNVELLKSIEKLTIVVKKNLLDISFIINSCIINLLESSKNGCLTLRPEDAVPNLYLETSGLNLTIENFTKIVSFSIDFNYTINKVQTKIPHNPFY